MQYPDHLNGLVFLIESEVQANPDLGPARDELQSRGDFDLLVGGVWRAHLREKPLRLGEWDSYRKPPQVDEASSLRGTGESSLRNSAKKLGVTSG